MNCLRDLRNNPTFSTKANDLIRKFKTDALKTTNTKPEVCKVATGANSKSVASISKPAIANKPNVVNKVNNTSKPLSATSSSSSSTSNKKPVPVTDNKTQLNKKRPTNEKSKPQDDSISKKPKLSLTDYKLLKGSNTESKSSDSRGSSSSTSSSQYEIESDSNLADTYSPTPRNALNQYSENKSQKIIMPPVPLVPLDKIIINETKPEPYEPISSSAGSKNMISKYSSSLNNSVSKAINNHITDDEVLTQIMRQKGQQKQIMYTGKRNVHGPSAQVPKLFDMSVRVLIEHLDDLPNRISIHSKIKIIFIKKTVQYIKFLI